MACKNYLTKDFSLPHGNQNYFRPQEELIKKEVLIGPVTALATPSFVNETCDGNITSPSVYLIARGPWVELAFDKGSTCKSLKTFRHLAFRGSEGGSVHGMKNCVGTFQSRNTMKDIWLFYGGRSLSFVFLEDPCKFHDETCGETYTPFTDIPVVGHFQGSSMEPYQAKDWIWDVRAIVDHRNCNGQDSFRVITALGLAYNVVEILSFESISENGCNSLVPTTLRKVVCDVRCITYSLNLFGWTPDSSNTVVDQNHIMNNLDLAVVVGTVSNEVLVWNVLDETEASSFLEVQSPSIVRKKILHRLQGHEGVIHSVEVGGGGKFLVSTSDDRTVRLWGQKNRNKVDVSISSETHFDVRRWSNPECEFEIVWTAYGHSARVWDASFISLNKSCLGKEFCGIVSVGEDSTIRIWDIENGSESALLKGHTCQSIWKVATNKRDIIVTGGNDGAVKIWDAYHNLIHNPSANKPTLGDYDASQMIVQRLSLPKDLSTRASTPTQLDVGEEKDAVIEQTCEKKKRKKPKKTLQPKQTVCGMAFYQNGDILSKKVLLATRAGTLMSLDVIRGEWLQHDPWSKSSDDDTNLVDATKGSCIAVHPSGNKVAVGTSRGEIVLSLIKDTEHNERQVFSALQYPAIQSLHWLDSCNLLAFHIKGTAIWWRLSGALSSNDYMDISSMESPRIRFVLSMARKGLNVGIPMSFYLNRKQNVMFVGDSRGNIAVFDCGDEDNAKDTNQALDVLSYTHKKEYVTCMIPNMNGNGILSVGNDGFVHEAILDAENGTMRLFSVIRRPVSCLTGISYIWRANINDSPNSIVVGGYHGNKFIVWDLDAGYQLLCVDTEGRNRQLELAIQFNTGIRASYHRMAILLANKNAPNELLLHSYNSASLRPRPSRYNLGTSCHGETVLDVACFQTNSGNILVLSGSNDCTVKLYALVKKRFDLVTDLQPHESCIRAVCFSKRSGSTSSLLVVCGGKLLSTFYRLDENDDETYTVTFLCTNKLQEKPAIDQRMNAVAAVALGAEKKACNSHLVLSGDSDGGLHFAVVTEEIGQPNKVTTYKLAEEQRPILSIDMQRISEQIIIACVGNTAGEVAVWALPGSMKIDQSKLPKVPLCIYRGNQAGTNCLATASVHKTTSSRIVIVNGGDDQALSFAVIHVDFDDLGNVSATPQQVVTAKEACASAIKGISIVREERCEFRIYTVGYDQRVSLWSLSCSDLNDASHLQFLSSTPVGISDTNTLACCAVKGREGKEHDCLIVGGEGLENLSLDPAILKAAKALKKRDYLLITCGAGFSADSGLDTYENMPQQYREFCDPLMLVENTSEFQNFWSQFSHKYAEAKAHEGYEVLERWCENKNEESHYVYSSNVDGHFRRFPSFKDRVCEIHGRAAEFRCSSATGASNGKKRYGSIWDKWNDKVADCPVTKECATSVFQVAREHSAIHCEHCSLPARPNVLLFHDTDENVNQSILQERKKYQEWEAKVEADVIWNGRNLVILEIGAGLNVPAVRTESEEVFKDTCEGLQTSDKGGTVTFIRINPKDAGFNWNDSKEQTISIYDTAKSALLMIDQALTSLS